jgi:6-phospho-beta-glucosidase
MAKHAPDAWLINFTNPAGMVTEAVQRVLGDRAIGICDSPAGLTRRVARALGRPAEDLWFDYFGLNHLGWLKGVRDGDEQLLPELLEQDALLDTFEEGRLFGGEWLRSLEMIPNEYLYYFYYSADTVNAIRQSPESRGAFLLRQQRAFYAEGEQPPGVALESWRSTRHDRERTYMAEARSAAGDGHEHEVDENGGYEGEAMAVLEAIANNTRAVLILNTANRSSLPFLDDRAVVEVPCVVGRSGPIPVAIGEVAPHARALVETMKDVERTTIDAALSGSRRQAIKALALHPLVPSVATARQIFDEYCERLPGLAEAFAK